MISQLFKVIGAGMLGGIFLFVIPIIVLKALFFFVLICLFFRMFGWRQGRRWMYYHLRQVSFRKASRAGRLN